MGGHTEDAVDKILTPTERQWIEDVNQLYHHVHNGTEDILKIVIIESKASPGEYIYSMRIRRNDLGEAE